MVFLQGGRSLALTADPQLRQAIATFHSLPPRVFETLSPSVDSHAQSVTVRQTAVDGAAFVYVLNDAPWPVSVELRLDGPPELRWELLGQTTSPQRGTSVNGAGTGLPGKAPSALAAGFTRVQGQWLWRLALDPHDFRAVRLDSPKATVRDWSAVVAPEVPQALQARMNSARARAHNLNSPPPLKTLANAGFEVAADTESSSPLTASPTGTATAASATAPAGAPASAPASTPAATLTSAPARWTSAAGAGITVALEETEPHGGQRSLRIRSERDVVWVRSAPIPVPATGRIAIWGWIRARDKSVPSSLRLAIEGKVDGKTYYRYATVGGGKGPPIPNVWTQYWFQIDDLPASELSELRVGIDLMGPGDVAIDDLAAYDLWFHDNERDELVKQLGLAGFQLGHGRLLESHRFLDGYWPRFLEEFVPSDAPAVEFTGTVPPTDAAPATSTGSNSVLGGPTSDRIPSGSLRRSGPTRPRVGPDPPSNKLPDPQGRPATSRPPAKPPGSKPPLSSPPTTTDKSASATENATGTRGAETPSSSVPAKSASPTDKPAAQSTWRNRLEPYLPKRFW
jgi:hypothetical protein